jgi:hypothetical protein
VPNDDLVNFGYAAGQRVMVGPDNIDRFLHYRDRHKRYSNDGRLQRQMAYINASIDRVKSMIEEDPTAMWDRIDVFEDSVVTSITRNNYLDLVKTLRRVSYDPQDMYTPEGESMKTYYYEEFYVDEDALLAKVIDLFYLEK